MKNGDDFFAPKKTPAKTVFGLIIKAKAKAKAEIGEAVNSAVCFRRGQNAASLSRLSDGKIF